MLKGLLFLFFFILAYLAILMLVFSLGGVAFWLVAWAVPSIDVWFNTKVGLTPFVAGGLFAVAASFFSNGFKSNGK